MIDDLNNALSVHANNLIVVGIVFDLNFATNPQNVDLIQYKIRLTDSFRNNGGNGGSWNTDQIFQNGVVIGPRNNGSANGESPGWYLIDFYNIQDFHLDM